MPERRGFKSHLLTTLQSRYKSPEPEIYFMFTFKKADVVANHAIKVTSGLALRTKLSVCLIHSVQLLSCFPLSNYRCGGNSYWEGIA